MTKRIEKGSRTSHETSNTIQGSRHSLVQILVLVLLYLALYILLDYSNCVLQSGRAISLWNPAAALNLAFILYFGLAYAPLIVIGSLISTIAIWHIVLPPVALVVLAVSNAFAFAMGGYWLRYRLKIDTTLPHLKDVISFSSMALLIPILAWAITGTVYRYYGWITPDDYNLLAISKWASDAVAMVSLTPFILLVLFPRVLERKRSSHKKLSPWMVLERIAQVLSIPLVLAYVFALEKVGDFQLTYLCLLPVLWISFRHGLPGAMWSVLATNSGIVVTSFLLGLSLNFLVNVQVLILVIALTGMLVGAMMTRERRNEAELRANEEKYRSVVEQSYDGIVLTDEKGLVLDWNRSMGRITGLPAAEVIGRPIWDVQVQLSALDVKSSEYRDNLRKVALKMLASGSEPWLYQVDEHPLACANGEIRLVQNVTFPIPTGQGFMAGTIFRDMTEHRETRAALQASDARLTAIFERAGIGIALIDMSGRILESNPALQKMLGYTREEFRSMTFEDFTHPDDVSAHYQNTRPVGFREQDVYHTSKRYIGKDGQVVWVNLVATIVRDDVGIPQYRIGLIEDITMRKEIEDALVESEERYRSLVDASPDFIVLTDLKGVIQLCNQSAARLHGYQSVDELVGLNAIDFLIPEEHDRLRKEIRRTQKYGWLRGLEFTFMRKDGSCYAGEANVSVVYDREGRPTGYTAINRDITERKRVEETIIRNEERLNLALEATNDGLWDWRIPGGDNYFSPRYYTMLGYEPGEFPTRIGAWQNLLHPDDLPEALHVLDDYVRGNIPVYRSEYRMRAKDDSWHWIMSRGKAVEWDERGTPVRLLGTNTDVTQRRQGEEQIRRQLKRLAGLRAIDLAITSSDDLQATLKILLDQASEQLNVDAANVLLFNAFSDTLDYAVGHGFHTDALLHTRLHIGEGYAGRAASERRMIYIPNLLEVRDGLDRSQYLPQEDFISYFAVPLIAKGQLKGVMEVFHRSEVVPDPEWMEYLEALSGQAAIAIDNATLFQDLHAANQELIQAYDATIEGWSRALELRDRETEGHTRRVTEMMMQLACEMGINGDELVQIRRGALLHDIGKMGIPDSILVKPGPLNREEAEIMRMHPVYAFQLLNSVPFLRPALDIPYSHHERWDGSGYPMQLSKEEIPLAARLFAVVDVYDALSSNRPYRSSWTKEMTLAYIRKESGKSFDPHVVEVFLQMIEKQG